MVKITVNTDTVNNTIPTTILLDKTTTNNSLDEEVGRVETELGEDEKMKLEEEEILSVEDELDEGEEGAVEVEESAVERLDVNLQKN